MSQTKSQLKIEIVRLGYKSQTQLVFCLQEKHFQFKETDRLKIKDRKRYTRQILRMRKLR